VTHPIVVEVFSTDERGVMPATLIWGKGFRLVDDVDPLGKVCKDVIGIEGGVEFLSWSSVTEIQSLAEQYGVRRENWPAYRDCEVPEEVPLEDAQKRSAELRIALEDMPARVIEEDHWLKIISRLLRDGNAFFIMV